MSAWKRRRKPTADERHTADFYANVDVDAKVLCVCGHEKGDHEIYGEPSLAIGCPGFREAPKKEESSENT